MGHKLIIPCSWLQCTFLRVTHGCESCRHNPTHQAPVSDAPSFSKMQLIQPVSVPSGEEGLGRARHELHLPGRRRDDAPLNNWSSGGYKIVLGGPSIFEIEGTFLAAPAPLFKANRPGSRRAGADRLQLQGHPASR